MALDKRYFDVTREKWVRSFDEPSEISAPVFGYKDNRDFSVQFLERLNTGTVAIIQDVVAAQIGLAVGTTLVTSATASSNDNNHFQFVLPVIDSSGSTLSTLMSGKTTPQSVIFQFKLTTARGTNRYFTNAFIAPQLLVDAVPDPAITEPATTMSEVAGVMVPKDGPPGGGFTMRSANGTAYFCYMGDDGEFHKDPI